MIITLQTLIFFRESLISVIDRLLRPYYKKITGQLKTNDNSEDEDSFDDHVTAEYDRNKGVVFFPPVYAQRYAAVVDCLMDERWNGQLEKVVEFGYHDLSFTKYLKDVPGVKYILGVDLESISLKCSSGLLDCTYDTSVPKREDPLYVTLFQGNAADPDYRLIGCDAVVSIEMIEHMFPHDLDRFVHNVFGFIKPRVVVLTTPNGDFNVLFKSLQPNGLRRHDHFFEWSREQFHDWCSNIVSRYPQYTVVTKGIGPGPPDTKHIGCCSQLALFVAKDYQKQPELTLNSLALVAKVPSPNNFSDMSDSWEIPDSNSNSMLCLENNDESYTKLLVNRQSCMTIVITTSPTFSFEDLRYQDKTLQCNLDMELGKNFLMFEDEMYFNVLLPSRRKLNRVYEIEDVASRLNCSTIQVKKFTKAAQGLMAKNKTDNFDHTREVVDEIRNLTKMLNFNKDKNNENLRGNFHWYNWGENAPYWNQYYRVVKEYNYPFEIKSEESRILDTISENINTLVDSVNPGDVSGDSQRIAIPIDQLMKTVDHITTNVDKVKDLLEWNGYDVVDDMVIHTRLVVDNISLDTQEDIRQEDAISDWDTSMSDGSAPVPDYNGRCILRVLDQKVRKLRTLLTADEDITTELDRIVCRLMKLALCTSKQHPDPPPANWMQLKLFDLLTLTEKAIERRRRHYFENYQMQPVEYYNDNEDDYIDIMKILQKQDNTVRDIVSKYNDVVPSGFEDFENDKNEERALHPKTINVTRDGIDEFDNNFDKASPINDLTNINDRVTFNSDVYNINIKTNGNMSKEIFNNNIGLVSALKNNDDDVRNNENKENETRYSTNDYFPKTHSPPIINEASMSKLSICKVNETTIEPISESKLNNEYKKKTTKVNSVKMVSSKINGRYKIKRKKSKEHQKLQSTLSKPIPDSLIKLCNPDRQEQESLEEFDILNYDNNDNENIKQIIEAVNDISATEESLFIGIVTEHGEEAIPLRRNIGIDPPIEFEIVDNEVLESVIDITKDNDFPCKTNEDVKIKTSDTIFIYDINEPTTSKGIRSLSTDVQCGPDVSLTRVAISATTSLAVIPNIFSNGIKIEDSETNTQITKKTSEFGTCTDLNNYVTRTSTLPNAMGITIKDSNRDMYNVRCSTMTQATEELPLISNYPKECASSETKVLKSESSTLKVGDSGSENSCNMLSLPKSPSQFTTSLKNISDICIQSFSEENIVVQKSQITYVKNLIYGGVHVHSFKERLVSEDVVYQGEWQRMRPSRRRNPQTAMIKRSNSLQKKKKPNSIEPMNTVNALVNLKVNKPKKLSIKPTLRRIKSNETVKKIHKNVTINNVKIRNETKSSKNQIKTTSVITTSTVRSKSRAPGPVYNKNRTDFTPELPETKMNMFEKKNYIPTYLRRRKRRNNSDCNSKNKFDPEISGSNKEKEELLHYIKEKIIKDLLKFTANTKIKNNYLVFRNEHELKRIVSPKLPATAAQRIYSHSSPNRNQSPTSQNSSSCSSPNSVATVRAACTHNTITSHPKGFSSKSVSIEKTSTSLELENKFIKNKGYTKRYKCTKKSPSKSIAMCSNKENVPESSKNIILCRKEISKKTADPLLGKTKDVFMAQAATGNSKSKLTSATVIKNDLKNLISTHDKLKDNQTGCITDESKTGTILKSNNILSANYSNNCINKDLTEADTNTNASSFIQSVENDGDELLSLTSNEEENIYVESPTKSFHNTDSIMFAIRQLIEQKIHITETSSRDSIDSGSETIILNRNDIHNNSFNSSSSPLSISTVIATEENVLESDALDLSENDKNVSVTNYTETTPTSKELDSLSIKSSDLSSVSTSKFSEYYLADNELDNTLNVTSVQDIFERNDRNIINNIDGLLAAQAFSGFSINTGSFVGDRLDNVNLVDSETGSIALSSARQAVSEELFVSGRSSDTYESCLVEDDISVPNWLFNAISQQPSIEESEAEEDFLPILLGEPVFDLNGNEIEPGVGIGAGAGDGRGIHSDQSQDSSGRGTSLSSSASSGPSEAILIDLSSVAAREQHNIHGPMNIPEIIVTNLSHGNVEGSNINDIEQVRTTNLPLTSDADADVSSLDTDAIDSDD